MKKGAAAGKIAEKTKKKGMNIKSRSTVKPAKKTIPKKKQLPNTKTKEKKPAAKKIKAGVSIKETPKKVIARIAGKPRTAVRKVTPKKEEKGRAKIKGKPKKTVSKTIKKPEKVPKKAIVKVKKKPAKILRKVVTGIEKKVPLEIKKVEVRKIIGKPQKKVGVKVKAEAEKIPEFIAGITEKPKKKAEKTIKLAGKRVPVKVGTKKKEAYLVTKEKYPPSPLETLPREYGENNITLITVDPYKLFSYWEVREDILKIFAGNLNIRVYDVTGIDFDGMDANRYFDIAAGERIGSCYIDVSPAKEFIADIGIIYLDGIFISMARSNRVSTPRATVSEEGVLPEKFYETGLYFGY